MMPYISGLRFDIWNRSSCEDRVNALTQLENHQAAIDCRPPAIVSSKPLPSAIRGVHFTDENGVERILINSEIINRPIPYQAVETCLHEDRHSHQTFIVDQHPEKAESQRQLTDWVISKNGGYIKPDDFDHSAYRWQPTEADSNKHARANTDDLYQNTFHDTQQYPAYKAEKEQEIKDSIEDAKEPDKLGENYEETARQMMINKFHSLHPEYQEESSLGISQKQLGRETPEIPIQVPSTVNIEKAENQKSMPDITPEEKADMYILTPKSGASVEGKETIIQPDSQTVKTNNPSRNPVNIEKPEEQMSLLGATPEDKAGIETLATKIGTSVEGKESVIQPDSQTTKANNPSGNPANIEKPEEQMSMPGATPEDRASIETLAPKNYTSVEGKETVIQPDPEISKAESNTSGDNEKKETSVEEKKRYGYGCEFGF